MSILIVVAALVVCFFLFPISTIEWIGSMAKKRAAAWVALLPKKKEESK